jgi:hypothetical protein
MMQHGAGVIAVRTPTPSATSDRPPGALAGRAIAVNPTDLDRVLEHIYRAGLTLKVSEGEPCAPEVLDTWTRRSMTCRGSL